MDFRTTALLLLGTVLLAGQARAGEPAPVKLDIPPPRDCPLAIACWAHPAITPAYCGYYVGGGAHMCCGDPRGTLDGTWGWDYIGCCYARRVMLNWWHGRRYQGGEGAYKVNGPRLLNLPIFHAGEACCK